MAAELGVPAVGVDALLARPDVDAVAICTSTDTHADLIELAARTGKAIFCEKPVSLDLAEVDRALAAVEAAGVPFQIGFNRRFDPAHAAVRDAVVAGEVGEPQLVRISSRDPAPPPLAYVKVSGGIFLDMTIHDFDMARYVAGSEVVEVFARGAVNVDAGFAEAGDVDTALVTLVHESGCLTAIDNSRQAVYGFDQRVEVFGSDGMAASENPLAHTAVVRTARGTRQTRCRTSTSSATCRATCASGRRSAPPSPPARRRRSARRTRAPRSSSASPHGARCASTGPSRSPRWRWRRHEGPADRRVGLRRLQLRRGVRRARRGARDAVARRARPDRPRRDAALRGRLEPDAIVHAAILNDPAAMAADRRAAWDAYVGATRNVVDAANAAGAQVVLVSTDWVFDGTQGPAAEDAPPNPVNQYGFLKAASELVVAERAERGTVARVAGVQGVHRARANAPRRAGPRLRLLRAVGRRGAAGGRAVHRLGERRDQHARDADARDRRGRADLARARARRARRAPLLRRRARRPRRRSRAARPRRSGSTRRWCAPARRRSRPPGAVPYDTRLDARATATRSASSSPTWTRSSRGCGTSWRR